MATIDLDSLPELRRGDIGDHVRFLQECLYSARLGGGSSITSEFDEETELAVLDFQQTNGLRDTGVVDRRTWRTLLPFAGHVVGDEDDGEKRKPELKRGSSGGFVHYLQEMLCGQLEPAISVDGDFGRETEAALKAFQDLNQLHIDGVAGEDTWKWLEYLHAVGHPPKRWTPPPRPEPAADEPDLPPPTPDEVEKGGELIWPFLTRAHQQAKWFAQYQGAMEEYKFEPADTAVSVGVATAEGGPPGAVIALLEAFGLGFLREQAYLAQYDQVVEAREQFLIHFENGLENGLAGRPFGSEPENPLLGGLKREVYDKVSEYSEEQRRWMRAWIDAHNGLDEALSLAR